MAAQRRGMTALLPPVAAVATILALLAAFLAAPAAAQLSAAATPGLGAAGTASASLPAQQGREGNPGGSAGGLQTLQSQPVAVNNQPQQGAAAQGNRNGFSDRDTLPPNGGYALYNFDAREPQLGVPDVLLTVKSSPAKVSIYCNPAWVTVRDEGNQPAGPNAVWTYEGDLAVGKVWLSSDNPIARPPEARRPGTQAYNDYTPSYNCTVINYDTDLPAHYTLSATYNFRDLTLSQYEQDGLKIIWEKTCQGRVGPAELAVSASLKPADGSLDQYLCGHWVAINTLGGKTPFTDFCKVIGNACNEAGNLVQFNLDGWNLGGEFPMEQIARFKQLQEFDLSNNPGMKGDLKQMFNALSTLENLLVVEVSGNQGFQGTFGYENTPENNRDTALCQVAEGGLRVMNMAGLGLDGLGLPDCLLGPQSTLQEVRLGNNGLVGTIPDNFNTKSPLQYLSMRGNKLVGTVPSTIGEPPELVTVDLVSNQFTGRIPETLGRSRSLRFLHLGINQLSGAVPEDLALHPTLEALDVRNNKLDKLPTEWYSASTALIAQSPLAYLRMAENTFTGDFPEVLARLPKLAVLDMAGNKFGGELPDVKGSFTALRYFDVSRNEFSGTIPAAFESCGVIRLMPAEAALVNQFTPDLGTPGELEGKAGREAFLHVFNISSNALSGALPIWLYADNVPTWAERGIDIHANRLTVDCGSPLPEQLQYLGVPRACPQAAPQAAIDKQEQQIAQGEGVGAPEGAAPLIAPIAAPAVVQAVAQPVPAPPDWNTTDGIPSIAPEYEEQVAASNDGSRGGPTGKVDGSGGGGLPSWGAALIAVLVVGVAVLAALAGYLAVRRRSSGHERGFLRQVTPLRPSGFKRFKDAADVESGDKGDNAQMYGGDSPPRMVGFGSNSNGYGAASDHLSQRA